MKLLKWYCSLNPTPFHLGCTNNYYLYNPEENWRHSATFMCQVYLMIFYAGLLIGCGKNLEILRHFQGKLCGKEGLLCGKLCGFFLKLI